MATPPYNVAVLAYATSGNTESDVETTGDPVYTLQPPADVALTLPTAGMFSVEWTYTPASGDVLTGFKVWVSNNPAPVWGSADDVGIPANDGGSPTITFHCDKFITLTGTVYAVVQAYDGDGNTQVSGLGSMLVEAPLPASVHVDGISESVNRICTGLEVNPIGGTPLLNLNGVAVPTVNNLIAGSNITLTPSGRDITIAAAGGGGGSLPAWITGHPDTPPASANAEDDEFENSTLNARWTETNTAGSRDINTSQLSHYWAKLTASNQTVQLRQNAPTGTGTFSMTGKVYMALNPGGSTPATFLIAHDAANTNSIFAKFWLVSGGWYLSLLRQNSGAYADVGAIQIANGTTSMYLHVQRDSGNVWSVWASINGRAFWLVASYTLSFTVDKIGWGADAGNSLANPAYVGIDWFRRDWITL